MLKDIERLLSEIVDLYSDYIDVDNIPQIVIDIATKYGFDLKKM